MKKKLQKPGPKSSKQSKIISNRGTLGDTTGSNDSSADESSTDDATVNGSKQTTPTTKQISSRKNQEIANASEFQTPDLDSDATDYGLEFTTSNIRNAIPRRCSTLRTGPGSPQERPTANRNGLESVQETSRQYSHEEQTSSGDDDDTPSTSMQAQLLAKSRPVKKVTQPKIPKPTAAATPKPTPAPRTQNPATVEAPAKKPRKRRNPMQLNKRFWNEVKTLQCRTDNLIPMLPFSRLIREIIQQTSTEVTKITPTALQAIQISSEMYLTQRMQDAYMLTLHRGRVTLDVRDMRLLNHLNI